MHIHTQKTSGNAREFPLPIVAAKMHKLKAMQRGALLSPRELRRIVAEMLG